MKVEKKGVNGVAPLVTVMMPAYNVEKYIGKSIESVLGQSFEDLELIIVEDCSSDKTLEIIQSFQDKRIRLVQNKKNMDYVHGLNLGLEMAEGKYIARIDSDDWMERERLRKQVEFLENNNEISVVGSHMKVVDEKGEFMFLLEYPVGWFQCFAWAYIDMHNPVGHPAAMFRKREIKEAGGYNLDRPLSEDLDLWFRLLRKGCKFDNIPEALTFYRKHESQTSNVANERGKRQWGISMEIVLEVLSDILESPVSHKLCEGYSFHFCEHYPFRSIKEIYNMIGLRKKIIDKLLWGKEFSIKQKGYALELNNKRITQLKKEMIKYPLKKILGKI